jgi:FtsP/CotA-like multicopper oxidase with cupredoxin domain
MRITTSLLLKACLTIACGQQVAYATPLTELNRVCPRPNEGSVIPDPPQTKSVNGVLSTSLTTHNVGMGPEPPVNNYDYRFCLLEHDSARRSSPVLRANPGDVIKLKFTNKLSAQDGFPIPHVHTMSSCIPNQNLGQASVATFNIHYHGLNIPPTCGEDDVLNTVIQPEDNTSNISQFTYQFQIPANDPPGLFWYHPHIHGTAQEHLLGGMTGVLVIEGMDHFFPKVKTMRERILVLRDMDKSNPADDPEASSNEPWKDVSVNYVPVIYGSKKLPSLTMAAGEQQFWRVANASADSHFVLQFQTQSLSSHRWQLQPMEVLARDGIPIVANNGKVLNKQPQVKYIVLAPGSRAEFIVTAPPAGTPARLYSADYNRYLNNYTRYCADEYPESGCDNSDRNPARTLANITVSAKAAAITAKTKEPPTGILQRFTQLDEQKVITTRKLFFSKNPVDDGDFFITVDGRTPKPFDMSAPADIIVQGPTVEDWTIENRDNESHVFHIHQIHFKVLEGYNAGDNDGDSDDGDGENVLRDTIEIPACRQWVDGIDPEDDPYGVSLPPHSAHHDSTFTGKNCVHPSSVKLRMDFRDRDVVGTFLYHCHILEHEDHGMMAKFKLK